MPYDLFVSYSRKDNEQHRVSDLIARIRDDYLQFAGEDLRCFFDLTEINAMDDWRNRILEGLRDSNLFLLVLSPAYLDSPHCEWEIVEFLKYEHSRSVGGQGVTPVYFVEIPGLDEPGFEQRASTWLARVRRRNQVDLRPWYHEGAEALKQADVRIRLDDLERSLHTRLSRLRRVREAPGNLPVHNFRFVGREAEMQRLHEAAGLGCFGALTAVQGMAGMGKTALAIQYAYAYADFYPGGRWLVGCVGETSLASVLRRLDLDLGMILSDAEKRDDNLAARRVLAELEHRAMEGAKARAGEKEPPQPKTLLLLDNVDRPELLQSPQSDLLTGRQWLHVLATTRSAAEDFGNDPEHLAVLSIDELPDDDALRLIESYQPGGRFSTPQEREAALALVKLLGGFTLAVEVVAVHLGERAGRVTCAAFLERMRKEGFSGLDLAAQTTKRGIRHGEKLVSATLNPTLDLLTEQERLVLSYAALLPPDTIPLPWLRALATKDVPELGQDAEPGYDDPWLSLVNHLLGLRLLQTVDLAEDGRTPRLIRMHRLLQNLTRERSGTSRDRLTTVVRDHLKTRSEFFLNNWALTDRRWEIAPLAATAMLWVEHRRPGALSLAVDTAESMTALSRLTDARRLLQEAMSRHMPHVLSNSAAADNDQGHDTLRAQLYWAMAHSTLAMVERAFGECETAKGLLRTAISIGEVVAGKRHPILAVFHSNMALVEKDPMLARHHIKEAIAIEQYAYGDKSPFLAIRFATLANIEHDLGNLGEARRLLNLAIALEEKALPASAPRLAMNLAGLALVEQDLGDLNSAEQLLNRSLVIRRSLFGLNSPAGANCLANLARLVLLRGRTDEAEKLATQAAEIWNETDAPGDPRLGKVFWTLGAVAARRGQADIARRHYLEALRLLRREHGDRHPWILAVQHELAALQ